MLGFLTFGEQKMEKPKPSSKTVYTVDDFLKQTKHLEVKWKKEGVPVAGVRAVATLAYLAYLSGETKPGKEAISRAVYETDEAVARIKGKGAWHKLAQAAKQFLTGLGAPEGIMKGPSKKRA